jgi:hypothetical protein
MSSYRNDAFLYLGKINLNVICYRPKGEPAPIITVNKDKVIAESKLPKVVKKEQVGTI